MKSSVVFRFNTGSKAVWLKQSIIIFSSEFSWRPSNFFNVVRHFLILLNKDLSTFWTSVLWISSLISSPWLCVCVCESFLLFFSLWMNTMYFFPVSYLLVQQHSQLVMTPFLQINKNKNTIFSLGNVTLERT